MANKSELKSEKVQDTISKIYPSFGSSSSSSSYLPEQWKERFDDDILCRGKCSKVSLSLHITQLWVYVPIIICSRNSGATFM